MAFNLFFWKKKEDIKISQEPKYSPSSDGGTYRTLFSTSFDGEKNLGEIGPIKNYLPDYERLRMRSWQSLLESEITQTTINRFVTWVIGSGLKLQSEPAVDVLKLEGISIDRQIFSKTVECRFDVYKSSSFSDYKGMDSIDVLGWNGLKTAYVGGDALVVIRYINDYTVVQVIDGAHVQSPLYGTEFYPKQLPNGNKIIHGVEIDSMGKHVAYYVRTADLKYERIEAYSKDSGLKTAFLVYGNTYRIDSVRGMPLMSAVLETLKKLERYKEATVGSAEERQKIVYQIVHQQFSTGENVATGLAKAFDVNNPNNDNLPKDQNGVELANTVRATTDKQTFNMPIGAEMKNLESKNELYFRDFFTVNFDIVCAAIGIPPNVAASKYDSNFSASRAALKDWEHTLNVQRKKFANAFYQPIYAYWLDIEILKNKVQAPGYLAARSANDKMILESFRKSRWVGPSVPHIDPVKEVNAERLKLGSMADSLPLTTVEAATENLNGGESSSNFEQFSEELNSAREFGIIYNESDKEDKGEGGKEED